MRTTTLFFALYLTASALLCAQPALIALDTFVPPPVATDSIPTSYDDWSVRAPLSPEEEQKRADNRARVERMKERFRAFQAQTEQENTATRNTAEEGDYLWSEAETGGQEGTQNTVAPAPKTADPEALRMEIGRSLHEGKAAENAPAAPLLPKYPSRTPAEPSSVQNEINTAFRAGESRATEGQNEWQAKVGSPTPEAASLPAWETGETVPLAGVYFLPGSAQIAPNSSAVLAQWAEWLSREAALRLEVRAYTQDNLGQMEAIDLSVQRAHTIVDYWVTQGAQAVQLSYRGYGALSPLVPADDPQAAQKNERIEVIILELPRR